MGLSIKWDITYKCNLNCGHCINGKFLNNNEKEIDISDIENIINKMSKLNIDYVHLLGGEPTFRKDFIEVGDCFRKKNIKFGFNTNGLNIANPKITPILFNSALSNIIFSLEGPTAEINDKIRGKNVFNIVTENIKKVVDIKNKNNLNNLSLSINTVVSIDNFDYIMDMIDLCISLGVDEFNLLQLVEDGNAEDKHLSISDEQELELVEKLAHKYKFIKNKLKIQPKFVRPIAGDYCNKILNLEFPSYAHNCGAGTKFCFINNKGELFPCDRYVNLTKQHLNSSEVSLINKDFFDIWSKKIFGEPFKLTEGNEYYEKFTPCNKCSHLKKDCFPCVVYGLNEKSLEVTACKKYFNLLQKEVI